MSDQTPSPEDGLPGDRADSTTTHSPWTPAPAGRPVWNEPAPRIAQPATSPDEQRAVAAPIDPSAAADQLADSPMPELDDNDPLLDTAQTGRIAIGGMRPAPMPTVAPAPIAPAPMPSTSGGYRPVPMPIGTSAPSAAPRPAQQATYSAPTGVNHTWQYPAWGTSFPPPNGPTPPPAAQASGRERGRGKRTALVTTTIALALVAGLGGGFIGAQLNNATTGSSATAAATALTQQTKNEQTSNSSGGSVESVASSVLPSVVSVVATSQSGAGEGSGVILTEDGYILTNNHVVEGATDLVVRFNDGATAAATVVGTDPTGDLAVIKADGVTGLTAATLGTSGDVQVGEQVVAIGSPLGLSATVTSGIVSALNRPVRTSSEEDQQQQQAPTGTASTTTILNAIQTDAAINPGNSGGPLVNMQGQIIGINSAIASLSSGESQSGSIGVGFAIPIDTAARIADEIIATGKATHAVLGASVGDAGDNGVISTGAEVKAITAGSAAEAAGLQVGDVVTRIDDVLVESADALVATVRSAAPNSEHTLTIIRDGSTETVNVTLGSTSE